MSESRPANPSSFRPQSRRNARRDAIFFETLEHLGPNRPYKGRFGLLRRALTLFFASPPESEPLELARRAAAANGWRLKVRVRPGGPPRPDQDGGAGVREPRRPVPPSGRVGAPLDGDPGPAIEN
jgi:hypothetical protein